MDLERIYTADEAADYLKLTRRAVITAGKRYSLCFVRGRDVRFTASHLAELPRAMAYKSTTTHAADLSGSDAFDRVLAKMRAENAARKLSIDARKAERRREAEQRAREKEEQRAAKRTARKLASPK